MAKAKGSVFFCGECGYESTKWLDKCPACGSWNTMLEQKKISSVPSINNLTYAHANTLSRCHHYRLRPRVLRHRRT